MTLFAWACSLLVAALIGTMTGFLLGYHKERKDHEVHIAYTPEEKRRTVDALYDAWCKVPELRLGQLIVNATNAECARVFYVEDNTLAHVVKDFASWYGEKP